MSIALEEFGVVKETRELCSPADPCDVASMYIRLIIRSATKFERARLLLAELRDRAATVALQSAKETSVAQGALR